MPEEELRAWLRLLLTPGIGPQRTRDLLSAFGLPEDVFTQGEPALARVVGPSLARSLRGEPVELSAQLHTTLTWLQADARRHIVTLGDPAYPPRLLQTADPPALLYVEGDLQALRHPTPLAIVGSRRPTPQGREHAQRFAQVLGEAGVCIVSGLAQGVDAAAHEGALASGAPTLAIVGTGLDIVYPRAHLALAQRIADQGALISEYPLGTPPLSAHFPRRNRIIAGLCHGTLVVEAALASGSLITARLAAEQGREVYAIPGSIRSAQSKGCHALIRQGAALVESPQDILEDLSGIKAATTAASASSDATDPRHPSDPLLQAAGFDPISLDELQARTGLDAARLQARLFELELDGQMARLPGGWFQRCGVA